MLLVFVVEKVVCAGTKALQPPGIQNVMENNLVWNYLKIDSFYFPINCGLAKHFHTLGSFTDGAEAITIDFVNEIHSALFM